jgi:hypothetical protein
MKKGKNKAQLSKIKRDEEEIIKFKQESSKVTDLILKMFKTAEMVSVDVEHKELTFYVMQNEFENMRKDIDGEGISLTYLKCDKDTISLYFKYTLKK